MSLRHEFVLKAIAGDAPIAALCREYGISRKTGYKWIRRFKVGGLPELMDQSRRPTLSPLQTSAEMCLRIIELRKQHPTWGPRKLWVLLARTTDPADMPSMSTVKRVVKSAGLVRRRRYRKISRGLPERRVPKVDGPNDLWTADFKGWWRTRDGTRCEPLTVRDAFSRFIFELRILSRTATDEVRAVFEALFRRYGLPKAIQTDNGPPFASARGLAGLTELSAWWISLGIDVVRSRPGCPQDNGAHERMHADVRFEIEADAAQSRTRQQAVCDAWRAEFNLVRPHEALGMKTPAEFYKPSRRRLGGILVGGFPEGCELLDVNRGGMIRYLNRSVYVTTALGGMQVGVQPSTGSDVKVWFYELLLGKFIPGRQDSVEPLVPSGWAPRARLPRGHTRRALATLSREAISKSPSQIVEEPPPPTVTPT